MTGRPTPLLAIGRSRLLLDTVEHLAGCGYRFALVVTAPENAEHDVGPDDFAALARRLDSGFLLVGPGPAGVAALSDAVVRRAVTAGITVNWQYLLPQSFLDLLPDGLLNLHVGRLPDYKGNATVNWAILNGEDEVDADVHRIVADLDAGDVVARRRIPITETTYVADVWDVATRAAPALFEEALSRIEADPGAVVVPGSPEGLRCYPRLPQDGLVDWTRSARDVARLVRASSRPYPGAFSWLGGRRVVVWRARPAPPQRLLAVPGHVLGSDPATGTLRVACGDGALDLEEISVDGVPSAPAALTRSIRARFASSPTA